MMDNKWVPVGIGIIAIFGALVGYAEVQLHPSISYTDTTMDMTFAMPKDSAAEFVVLPGGGEITGMAIDGDSLFSYTSMIVVQDADVQGVQYGSGDNLFELDMTIYKILSGKDFGPGTRFYVLPALYSQNKTSKHHLVITSTDPRACRIFQFAEGELVEVT